MSQPESRLSRKIIAELNKQDYCFAWKNHGSKYTLAGLPDVIVCLRGKFYGLEVKLPGRENTTTPIQLYIHSKIQQAGGGVFVVTSVQSALAALSIV